MRITLTRRFPRHVGWLAVAAALVGAACDDDDDDDTPQQPDAGVSERRCAVDNGGIDLPSSFCASVFADDLGHARHLTVTPTGDVFVAIQNAPDGSTTGGIVALRDRDDDGKAEEQHRFGSNGGHGIAWRDGWLYFGENERIVRFRLPDGELVPTDAPEVIVDGLPATGDHPAKTILFDGNGDLLVNIGSASNACQVENRVPLSPGMDPCPELDSRAGVWRFAADTLNQTPAQGMRVVSGLRNGTALDLEPTTNKVVAVSNGRDHLHDNWPALFTMEEGLQLPGEELTVLQQGADHGWPYCYYDPRRGMKMLAPEYGGDGETEGRCAAVAEPEMSLPAHWAPLGIHFYTGDRFPAQYRDGAFVASHGSRFEPEATGDLPGYNVVFVPFEGGNPVGTYEVFADGFAGDGRPLPGAAAHRPVDVAEHPDGSLFISDDHGGRIWRVFHERGDIEAQAGPCRKGSARC